MKRFAQALDLVDDAAMIAEYERHHRAVWPEVERALCDIGIESMRIYRTGTRLFMVCEARDGFDPARDFQRFAESPRGAEWDAMMRKFQRPVPGAPSESWWTPMTLVYDLHGPRGGTA